MDAIHFPSLDQAKCRVSFVHTSSLPTLQPFTLDYPQGDRGGNEICMRVTQAGQPMDLLHRFWDGMITSSSNLTRSRNEATALRNRQEFQRAQLTQLASTVFEDIAFQVLDLHDRLLINLLVLPLPWSILEVWRQRNVPCWSLTVRVALSYFT